MPIDLVVADLSGSDEPLAPEGPEAPDQSKPKAARRKRSREELDAQIATRSSDQRIRFLLGRQCGCKRNKNCFAQFIPADNFSALKEYLGHWHDLHKLDQDHFVAWKRLSIGSWPDSIMFSLSLELSSIASTC